MAAAPDGGEILLRADQGNYAPVGITLSAGGSPIAKVKIRGVNQALQPMKAVIKGSRGWTDARGPNWVLPANPETPSQINTPNWNVGQNVFTLAAGADNLEFSHIRFEHLQRLFNITAPLIQNVSFHDIDTYNIQRFNNMGGSGPSCVSVEAVNFTFKDMTGIGNSENYFQIRCKSHGWSFDNVHLNGGYQTGNDFPRGFAIDGTAHDILIENSSAQYMIEDQNSNYWQGDGVSTEGEQWNITIRNSTFSNNGDGGIDAKGCNLLIENVTTFGNKHGMRLWGGASGTNNPICTWGSIVNDPKYGDTKKRCDASGNCGSGDSNIFTANATGSRVVINRPVGIAPNPTGGKAIFSCHPDAGGQMTVNDTSDVVVGGASLTSIAPGCTLTINP